MSNAQQHSQLKTTLIEAIKDKEAKIFEAKKILLNIIEESFKQCSKTESLDSLTEEQLAKTFNELVVPSFNENQVKSLAEVINFLTGSNSEYFTILLKNAIGSFSYSLINNYPVNNSNPFQFGQCNPVQTGFAKQQPTPQPMQPPLHVNAWGQPMQMQPQNNAWGQPTYPGFNPNGGQQSSFVTGTPTGNFQNLNPSNIILLQSVKVKLKNIYKTLANQNVDDKILKELSSVIEINHVL